MYQLLLFDFDGTLADSLPQGLAQYNFLAEQYGFLPVRNLDDARRMDSKEFFRAHKIPLRRLPRLYREFVSMQRANMPLVSLYDGMSDVLSVLSDQYRLGILSSNSEENIRACLAANQAEGFFEFIQSHNRIFGKHTSIRKILKAERLRPEEIIYIGDEVRDAVAARRARVPYCAVSWGIHPVEMLLGHSPLHTACQPADLLQFFDRNPHSPASRSTPVLA